jgi:hypothetical protein
MGTMNAFEDPDVVQNPIQRELRGDDSGQRHDFRIGRLDDFYTSTWSVVRDARTTFCAMPSTEVKRDKRWLRRVRTWVVALELMSDDEKRELLAVMKRGIVG